MVEYRGPKRYKKKKPRRPRTGPDKEAGQGSSIPVYGWGCAPANCRTLRQLRAEGLRPGGQPIIGELRWRRGQRFAYLYDVELAVPKRTATASQLEALGKALAARRVCPICQQAQEYEIPRSLGCCTDCWNQTTYGRRHPIAA